MLFGTRSRRILVECVQFKKKKNSVYAKIKFFPQTNIFSLHKIVNSKRFFFQQNNLCVLQTNRQQYNDFPPIITVSSLTKSSTIECFFIY